MSSTNATRTDDELSPTNLAFTKMAMSGEEAAKAGDIRRALAYFVKALRTYPEASHRVFGPVCKQAGACFAHLGQHDTAFAHFRKAYHVARKHDNLELELSCLEDMAASCRMADKLEKAVDYYKRAVTVARSLKDRPAISRNLDALGQLLHRFGNFATVEWSRQQIATAQHPTSFDRAAAFYKKSGLDASDSRALHSMAGSYMRLRDYDRAVDAYTHLLNLMAERNELGSQREAQVHCSLGNAYRAQGKYLQAIESYKRDIETTEKLGDKTGLIVSHSNLGGLYQEYGDMERSITEFNKALDLASTLQDLAAEFRASMAIGRIHEYTGQYALALEMFVRAQSCAARNGDEVAEQQASQLRHLCQTFVDRGITFDPSKEQETDVDALMDHPAVAKSSIRGIASVVKLLPRASFRGNKSGAKSRAAVPWADTAQSSVGDDSEAFPDDVDVEAVRRRSGSFRERIRSWSFRRSSTSSEASISVGQNDIEAAGENDPQHKTVSSAGSVQASTASSASNTPLSRPDSRRFSIKGARRAAARVSAFFGRKNTRDISQARSQDSSSDGLQPSTLISVAVDSQPATESTEPSALEKLTRRSKRSSQQQQQLSSSAGVEDKDSVETHGAAMMSNPLLAMPTTRRRTLSNADQPGLSTADSSDSATEAIRRATLDARKAASTPSQEAQVSSSNQPNVSQKQGKENSSQSSANVRGDELVNGTASKLEVRSGQFVAVRTVEADSEASTLPLEPGDVVVNIEVLSNGMWRGTLEKTGQKGMFPASAVEMAVAEDEETSAL